MKTGNYKFNKEIIQYLFFGVLTTIINYSIFAIGIYFFDNNSVLIVNLLAFSVATVFAFITNKLFVFERSQTTIFETISEFFKFVLARIFALLFEQMGLFIGTHWFEVNKYFIYGFSALMILKIILSFVSVILNYLASKFIVFSTEKKGE